MSFDEVGRGFVQQYYSIFCTNRPQLAGVYRSNSLLTWVGEQLQGNQSIVAKLASLSFTKSEFKPEDVDCQPSLSGGVMIVVNGECLIDAERHPLKFNDVFHLANDNGQWYVSNQIFRIIGGGGV